MKLNQTNAVKQAKGEKMAGRVCLRTNPVAAYANAAGCDDWLDCFIAELLGGVAVSTSLRMRLQVKSDMDATIVQIGKRGVSMSDFAQTHAKPQGATFRKGKRVTERWADSGSESGRVGEWETTSGSFCKKLVAACIGVAGKAIDRKMDDRKMKEKSKDFGR